MQGKRIVGRKGERGKFIEEERKMETKTKGRCREGRKHRRGGRRESERKRRKERKM